MAERLRIGSRGSDLALWQARYVQQRLRIPSEVVVIKTEGDRIQHLSLDKVEGKGFFTKEIEAALLQNEIDVAVHSFKDLPIEQPPGLVIAAVPARAPVRDALVVRRGLEADPKRRWGLPEGARVGTSSLRRKAALGSLRPDLRPIDLRGNLPTRVRKARDGTFDAVLVAEAGLRRLGFIDGEAAGELRFTFVSTDEICPAPAQGALAIQIREGDEAARAAVAHLHDPPTATAVAAERRLLGRFGGGCHLPLGVHVASAGDGWRLEALVAAPDGSERIAVTLTASDPVEAADRAHEDLVQRGAERYL